MSPTEHTRKLIDSTISVDFPLHLYQANRSHMCHYERSAGMAATFFSESQPRLVQGKFLLVTLNKFCTDRNI